MRCDSYIRYKYDFVKTLLALCDAGVGHFDSLGLFESGQKYIDEEICHESVRLISVSSVETPAAITLQCGIIPPQTDNCHST